MHASAYYGLARIALLEKDLDAAERLFQKSLEFGAGSLRQSMGSGVSGPAFRSRRRDATKQWSYFQSALQLEGATEKARQEAKQGLELTKKKQ